VKPSNHLAESSSYVVESSSHLAESRKYYFAKSWLQMNIPRTSAVSKSSPLRHFVQENQEEYQLNVCLTLDTLKLEWSPTICKVHAKTLLLESKANMFVCPLIRSRTQLFFIVPSIFFVRALIYPYFLFSALAILPVYINIHTYFQHFEIRQRKPL
jgi:hypothetical protein